MNENNVNGHILFGMMGHDCVTTICNGQILMKDRRIQIVDEEKIYADIRDEAAGLWKSING